MKSVFIKRTISIIMVLLWMGLIFFFSSQTGESSGGLSGGIIEAFVSLTDPDFEELTPMEQEEIINSYQLIVRKLGHFSEYLILGVLCANLFNSFGFKGNKGWIFPLITCAFYAATDEIHQYFVPDRAMSFIDVLIDTSGALCGILLYIAMIFFLKKIKNKKIRKEKI